MYVVSSHYNLGNALLELVQSYYRGTGGPVMGTTKKEQDAHDNKNWGFRLGIGSAIAEVLTVERAKKFPLLDKQVKIDSWWPSRVLDSKDTRGLFHSSFPDGDIASQIVDRLLALIDGENGDGAYAKNYEEFRRAKVLKGEVDPTEADREWLEEMKAEQEAKIAFLQGLQSKTVANEKGDDK